VRRTNEIDPRSRSTYGPQVLPWLQFELEALTDENAPSPLVLEAKIEIFLKIFGLWQAGQVTSPIWLVLSMSSSNGVPQSVQMNSKTGIIYSQGKMSEGNTFDRYYFSRRIKVWLLDVAGRS
jgi:hypothetical protein